MVVHGDCEEVEECETWGAPTQARGMPILCRYHTLHTSVGFPLPADIYTLPASTTSASEARRADYAGLTCTHESVEVRSVGGNGCGVCEMRIADMHTN